MNFTHYVQKNIASQPTNAIKSLSLQKYFRNFVGYLSDKIHKMENLPKDPAMLLSFINMKLRDAYRSLDELCEDMHIDKEELLDTLRCSGFEYSAEFNRFR